MAAPASTPLSLAFFSSINMSRVQDAIKSAVYQETGYSIRDQNPNDLSVLMKTVYSKTFGDPYTDIDRQLEYINRQCVVEAMGIMKPRIAQDVMYQRNLGLLPPPPAYPGNTSTYGKKIPFNTKIGF